MKGAEVEQSEPEKERIVFVSRLGQCPIGGAALIDLEWGEASFGSAVRRPVDSPSTTRRSGARIHACAAPWRTRDIAATGP